MPRMDGTGPRGKGPQTGRGLGPCKGRPRQARRVRSEPDFTYFKPAGVRLSELQEVVLSVDEFEAIRLTDSEELDQAAAAEKMKVSQPTLHRILSSARKKLANAMVEGKAIRIEGGQIRLK